MDIIVSLKPTLTPFHWFCCLSSQEAEGRVDPQGQGQEGLC